MPLSATATSLAEVLDEMTGEGAPEVTEHLLGNALRCYACGHRCLINEGKRGICKVRFNEGGHLRVPMNYVAALACDPTEKKPFFHVLPGSDTLTFGMLGCDLHCAYCQNWLTSQALRDDAAVTTPNRVTADRLISMAKAYGAAMVGSSYNEPLITAEWAVEVFQKARPQGFRTAFISNGNATPQVLDYLRPWTDCYKIDLKSMSDKNYRQLGGVVDNILETVKMVHERGFWEEIVTLVIPGFNDSAGRAKARGGFHRFSVARHSLARDGVSSGLSHDGKREHDCRAVDSCLRDWARGRPALHLCRQPSGPRGPLGEHLLPFVRRTAGRALRLFDQADESHARRKVSVVRDQHSRHLGVMADSASCKITRFQSNNRQDACGPAEGLLRCGFGFAGCGAGGLTGVP